MPQRPTVAARLVQVAGSTAGVVRHGHEPGRCAEMPGGLVGPEVACGDQQLGAEDGPEAGHRLDRLRLVMLVKGCGDLLIEALDSLVELQDASGEFSDDHLRYLLAGQFGVLTTGGRQGAAGDAATGSGVPRRAGGAAAGWRTRSTTPARPCGRSSRMLVPGWGKRWSGRRGAG